MPVSGRNDRAQPGLTTQMARFELSFSNFAERARRAARGSLPPAGVDPEQKPDGPDGRQRRAIRQRMRRTRALRRARVAELGALVADMRGRGRWNQRLVDDWSRRLEHDDGELTGLDQALRGERQLGEVPVAECDACGRIGGARDRFCAGCGGELTAPSAPPPVDAHGHDGATLVGDLTTIRS
jgi:hypothetical protein